MPLFAPLSQAERKALRAAPALALPQQLASLLQLHHTRVIECAASDRWESAQTLSPPFARRVRRRGRLARSLFRALDKNADGQVTKPELAEALSSLGVQASREELDLLFERLDPDGSGGIVFRELQLAILAATREEPASDYPARGRESVRESGFDRERRGGFDRQTASSSSRAVSRANSRSASRGPSRPSSRPGSRGASQPPSPRWHSYETTYAEAATGLSGPPTLTGEGSGGADGPTANPYTLSSHGPAVGVLTDAEYRMLDEMITLAVSEATRDGGACLRRAP